MHQIFTALVRNATGITTGILQLSIQKSTQHQFVSSSYCSLLIVLIGLCLQEFHNVSYLVHQSLCFNEDISPVCLGEIHSLLMTVFYNNVM